jgi:hypothetical protein
MAYRVYVNVLFYVMRVYPNAVKKADPRKMEDASKPAVGYSRMT